jgi:hypothetical protein
MNSESYVAKLRESMKNPPEPQQCVNPYCSEKDPHFHWVDPDGEMWILQWPPNEEFDKMRVWEKEKGMLPSGAAMARSDSTAHGTAMVRDQTPIEAALSRAGATVQQLDASVERLLARIEKVTQQTTQFDSKPVPISGPEREVGPSSSPMLQEINVITTHVADIIAVVEDVMGRLDI